MNLGCALSCLVLALSGVSASFSSPSLPQVQNEWIIVEPKERFLYVDLSLWAQDGLTPLSCSLTYLAGEVGEELGTSNIYDCIYKTDSKLPPEVLAYAEAHITVHAYLGEDELFALELLHHPFGTQAQYDYVCIDRDGGLSYGHYGEVQENPGATYETQRVFLVNDNPYFYDEDEWGNPCVNAVGYYAEDSYRVTAMTFIPSSKNGRKYYYADIPYQVGAAQFLRLPGTVGHQYAFYQTADVYSLASGVCYFAGVTSAEEYSKVSVGGVLEADAAMLGTVVESYLTYGKDDSNGCTKLTVSNLFSTWFENKSATNEDLKTAKILDYTGYSANGNSYEGLTKNAQFSVNEKWNTMCSQAGIDPKTGKERGWFFSFLDISNPILLIGVVIGLSLVISLIVMFVLLARKKRREA